MVRREAHVAVFVADRPRAVFAVCRFHVDQSDARGYEHEGFVFFDELFGLHGGVRVILGWLSVVRMLSVRIILGEQVISGHGHNDTQTLQHPSNRATFGQVFWQKRPLTLQNGLFKRRVFF